jgi:hypothetical protein
MSQTERQKRLRLLVKKLNRERKRQASRVDILCNDLIGAQREFMRRLNQIGFAARFYKGLLGAADLRTVVIQAGRLLRDARGTPARRAPATWTRCATLRARGWKTT